MRESLDASAHQLQSDGAIRGGENSPDLLNRSAYAKTVAQALEELPRDAGFVVSVEDRWGTGKTSFINLVAHELRQQKAPPLIWHFNPWQVGHAESLIEAFLIEFAGVLGQGDAGSAAGKAAKELLAYTGIFRALKLIPGAQPFAEIIESVMKTAGDATADLSKLKESGLQARRDRVVTALGKLQQPIVIFMDDMDRLLPAEVFQMIRLVKAVAEFPGVAYVLCYDHTYLEEALQREGIAKSASYLDKIIQVRLTLPRLDSSKKDALVMREYNRLPGAARHEDFPDRQARFLELYHHGLRSLFETPRDIVRIFNRLRFVEPACRGEVVLGDLIALEALAIKAPCVYAHMREDPSAYLGYLRGENKYLSSTTDDKYLDLCKPERDKALAGVSSGLHEGVRSLLEHLFPSLAKYGVGVSNLRTPAWGRIAAWDRLLIALQAGLPSNELPYQHSRRFITEPASRPALLSAIKDRASLSRFLYQLRGCVEDALPTDVPAFLSTLAAFVERSVVLDEGTSPSAALGLRPSQTLAWVAEQCLASLAPPNRLAAIDELVKRDDMPSTATYILMALYEQHGIDRRLSEPEAFRWANTQQLEAFTRLWAQACETLGRRLLEAAEPDFILWRLARFAPDTLSGLMQRALLDDQEMDAWAGAMGITGYGASDLIASPMPDVMAAIKPEGALVERARSRLSSGNLSPRLEGIYTAWVENRRVEIPIHP